MKKIVFALLCLSMSACGTFDIHVQISPKSTDTAFVLPSVTSPAVSSPAPTQSLPTTTPPSTTATLTVPPQDSPTPDLLLPGQSIALAALQMSDTSRGWALESTGHVVKTSDGGLSWQNATPSQARFGIHSLFALDSNAVWVVPAQATLSDFVWRTRDGGSTWQASQAIALGDGNFTTLALQFPDARHGWLLLLSQGGADGNHTVLYRSADGGVQWDRVTALDASLVQSYLPDTNTSMAFFDGQTGWLGGWWGRENPDQWLILQTGNGGKTWDTHGLALPGQPAISCNETPIPQPAGSMAVDATCISSRDPKYLYHRLFYLSTSMPPAGWNSWKISGQFLGATFLNPSQGWMLLSSDTAGFNKIQYTEDGGQSWNTVSFVAWKQAQFDFVSAREGWAIVGDGFATALVHTTNGGKLWVQMRPIVADR